MKSAFKVKLGNKVFQIKTSSSHYKLSITKSQQKASEKVLEWHLNRAFLQKFSTAIIALLGGGGASALFL